MEKEFMYVNPVFDDIFAQEQKKDFSKVFYFGKGTDLEEARGKIRGIETNEVKEEFLAFDSGDKVRVDRIITINSSSCPPCLRVQFVFGRGP